jgi:hypothetical protein
MLRDVLLCYTRRNGDARIMNEDVHECMYVYRRVCVCMGEGGGGNWWGWMLCLCEGRGGRGGGVCVCVCVGGGCLCVFVLVAVCVWGGWNRLLNHLTEEVLLLKMITHPHRQPTTRKLGDYSQDAVQVHVIFNARWTFAPPTRYTRT